MSGNTQLAYRLCAVSGIMYIALMFVGFAMTDSNPPSPQDPASVIASYMAMPEEQSSLAVSLILAATFVFFWFLAGLRQILSSLEGDDGWLTQVAYGGGLVFVAMALVATGFMLAGQVLSDYGTDTQVAKTLFVLMWDYIYVFGPPLAALVSATAAIILRQSAFPRWLGWMSLPFAALLVIPPLAWPGVPFFYLWVAILSVVLARRGFAIPRRSAAVQPT